MKLHCLTVGINEYVGCPLFGCLNDATDWADEWTTRKLGSLKTIVDAKAPRRGIIKAWNDVFAKCSRGDWALFALSGHGSQVADESGDEKDGLDEAFVPYDFAKEVILDDEFASLIGNRPPGVRVFVASDACHSASMFRAIPVGLRSTYRVFLAKYMPPWMVACARVRRAASVVTRIPEGVLWLSGCADNNYSYDAIFNSRSNGALTRNAIDVLPLLKNPTFANWERAIKRRLPSDDYPQTPKMNGRKAEKGWRVPWL